MMVNSELERMWKEAVEEYVKLLLQIFVELKNTVNHSHHSRVSLPKFDPGISGMKSELLLLEPTCSGHTLHTNLM
jgi:hypothetical protein